MILPFLATVHKIYLNAMTIHWCSRPSTKRAGATPNVHPLLHSEKGFPYTNRAFHQKPDKAGMTKAMSRVAHCINNGPLEGLWGILKGERYSDQRFTGKMDLSQMILHPLLQHPARTAQP